jgi:hypothetical protein
VSPGYCVELPSVTHTMRTWSPSGHGVERDRAAHSKHLVVGVRRED